MDNPYLEVISYVERIHRQFLEVVKLELEGFGIHDINNVQAMMLFNIGDAEMTVGELTLRGCYLGSNISYNVRKMVENEYLAHERSVHDRRSIHVRLTEKGIKLRDSLTTMHRRQAEMLSRAAVGADDLQAVGVTLRRLERFWIRAADLVQRPQPLAPGSSSPAQPLFRLMHDLRPGGYGQGNELVCLRDHRTAGCVIRHRIGTPSKIDI